MATRPFVATIIGIPHIPSIRLVNVRSGAGTNYPKIAEIPVGVTGLLILDVRKDEENRNLNGKVYQWMQVGLPDGQTGWVRDDLINVLGDGSRFGYMMVFQPVLAFNLQRSIAPVVQPVGEREPEPDIDEVPMTDETAPAGEGTGTQPTVDKPDMRPIGEAMVQCMVQGGANLRAGAGTNHGVLGRFTFRDRAKILDVADATDGVTIFKWFKITYQGRESWIREDLVRLSGDFERFGTAFADLYPSPAPDSHWIRDYDETGEFITKHFGWDHAGAVGAPILGGPNGGYVVESKFCTNCGISGSSVQDKGLMLNAPAVFTPPWNFGYGHYVIVRYTNDQLPESTRIKLNQSRHSGAHLFVMYAHLHQRLVEAGQELQPNQTVGTLGNSGNSSGPHLHLEVRIGNDADETVWARLRSGLTNPKILFLR